MKLLLIDNYDSFTFILKEYLITCGAEVVVARNDVQWINDPEKRQEYDGLVFSPGPGLPEEAGALMQIIAHDAGSIPMLGVCLGHQAVGICLGGLLKQDRPWHGKQTAVFHHGHPLFNSMKNPFQVGRYHSWHVELDKKYIIAHSEEGICMALAHDQLGIWGVQFHPESCMTENGHQILTNFLSLCTTFRHKKR